MTLLNTSQIQSGAIQNYEWVLDSAVFNSTDVIYNFTTAGVYPVQLIQISDLGCTDTLLQNITINALPTTNVVGNSPICPNTNTPILASGGEDYQWTANPLLSADDIANPIVSILDNPATFYVQVTDSNQCINNESLLIHWLLSVT